jgi:hypothetical protein
VTGPKDRCVYCGRDVPRAGLEPCCDRSEHAARLACVDVSRRVRAVLAQLHDSARMLTGAETRTVLDVLDVAADYKRDRTASCPDCDASPADLCAACEWRLVVADGYDALAKRIGGQR